MGYLKSSGKSSSRPTKAMQEAWSKEANKNYTKENVTLGVLAGGCPSCGHLCDFDQKTFRCRKCGWHWRKVKI